MKTTIFCLLSLFSVTLAALSGATNGQLTAGGSQQITLSGSGTLSTLDSALVAALGATSATATTATVTVSSSTAASISVSIGADVNGAFSASLFASGTNAPQVGLLSTLSGSGALQIIITSSAVTQLTLQLTIPTISLLASTSALASSGFGLHLLAPSTEFAANGQTGATFYGAVALSVSGGTYTYTIPINVANTAQTLYLTGLDALQALAASGSASVSASTNANGGSAVFNANANANAAAKLFPITYNTAFPLVANVQYSYGRNIQVAPFVNGTTLAIALNNNFAANGAASGSGSSAVSAAPSTQNGGYFNGNYQFSGSNGANNLIQWQSDANSQFTTSAGATTSTASTQFANAASWYKSQTAAGTAAAAGSWQQVSSYRSNVNGKVTVWAQVQSYSQWTVASSTASSGNSTISTTGAASNVQIGAAAIFAALALVLAF